MDDRYLTVLEYFKITEQLADHTAFSASRELALALRPSNDERDVRTMLQETTEAKDLLSKRPEIGIGGARDIRPLVRRAMLDAMLQPTELLEVRNTLSSARYLHNAIGRLTDECPLLADLAASLQPYPDIIEEIGRCLDDDGRVLDSASTALASIRRESNIARDRLTERLHRIVGSGDNGRYLQDNIVTERNGRYVIPLKVEYKGRIPGIIHDQSSSGATLFIEPLETVELNNQWRELQLQEQREIEHILMELTALVGREAEYIVNNIELIAALDLAFAKGKYSFALRAAPAQISPRGWPKALPDAELTPGQHPINLIRARHPLLPRESVVPIDVYMGGNYTVLLITGPNTGGKTVSLKTVGLMAAMTQSGLHIPATDGSCLPVFDSIYADIGDEQSIEQSLSTFSSHMSHIIDILNRADRQSLVLLDELGAGTDPLEGAALAQAIVTTLLERQCLTVSSTHYSQLKVFAFSTPGVQNASVDFDLETLSPTYHLQIGLPGRSNALAIAQRLGLSEAVITLARRWVSPEEMQADALLTKVKEASEQADLARTSAQTHEAQVEAYERDLRQKLDGIEEMRRQVLDDARAEGREELDQLRRQIRQMQLGLQRANAPVSAKSGRVEPDHGALREALKQVERMEEEVAPLAPLTPAPLPETDELRIGDTVLVTTLGQTGELLALNGQEAEVRIGGFRLRSHRGALQFQARPVAKAATPSTVTAYPTSASPGIELDLRGWRAEEVASALDKYLDDAYMAGLPWVHIIHGKGMGVLKNVVRQFLAGHPLVSSHRPGAANEGGEGVTVVTLQSRG